MFPRRTPVPIRRTYLSIAHVYLPPFPFGRPQLPHSTSSGRPSPSSPPSARGIDSRVHLRPSLSNRSVVEEPRAGLRPEEDTKAWAFVSTGLVDASATRWRAPHRRSPCHAVQADGLDKSLRDASDEALLRRAYRVACVLVIRFVCRFHVLK